MKTGFLKKTIVPAIMLLCAAAQAADQQSPAAAVNSATEAGTSTGSPAAEKSAIAPVGVAAEKKAPAEESPTITMTIPLFSPLFATTPVAEVNDESITVDDLVAAIGALHTGMEEQKTAARKSYAEILNRLINIKLIVQEAKNIELDQSQQIKDLLSQFEKATLREILLRQRTKDVKPDESEVEKLYRERVKEWKVASFKFTKEDDAKKIAQEIKRGGSFDQLMEKAVKDGLAEGSKEAVILHASAADLQIAKAVEGMKVGSVSPVVPVKSGFAIFRLEEVRFPESAETRQQAWLAVLNKGKQEALNKYRDELFKKYVKVDSKFLKKVDFEAPKPGFAKMLDDKRVIARIKGEQPVTVADLAQAINEKYFHGVDSPIKEKKVNVLKSELLDNILSRRVVMKEALSQGIDKTPEFLGRVKDNKETVLFGAFVENVVRRDVRLPESELKAYYQEHVKEKEYIYPGMVRITGLAFTSMEAAQAGVDNLRKGVDFKWLKSTAEGQVADDAPGLLKFDGSLLATTTLPDGLDKVLTGVHSNDHRLFADSAGHYYALQIKDFIPPREMSYEEARETIRRKVYDANLKKAIEDWTKKLRSASDVKVYADFREIR